MTREYEYEFKFDGVIMDMLKEAIQVKLETIFQKYIVMSDTGLISKSEAYELVEDYLKLLIALTKLDSMNKGSIGISVGDYYLSMDVKKK